MKITKVSVGIPVYNGGKWIADTLDSILSQTYPNIEIIISDNVSTDDTESICKAYTQKYKNIKYYRNKTNIGVSNNFNAVFKYSTGDYFKWSSVSDIVKPDFIQKCLDMFETDEELVLVCPGTILFNEEAGSEEKYEDALNNRSTSSKNPVERFIQYLEHVQLNNIMNGVIKRNALEKTGLYKKFLAADINMIAELALYGKFCVLPEYLFYRRMEEEAATKFMPVDVVLKYYDPSNKSLMLFQFWIMDLYYIGIIKKAPLTIKEKWTLYLYIARKFYWDRKRLGKDFKDSMRCLPGAVFNRWSNK